MYQVPKNTGWIEVVCGSMFSGKTEELIRRLRRAKIAKQKVEIFKPQLDSRYSKENIVSHDARELPSRVVKDAYEIIEYGKAADVVGIDEAQFFGPEIVKVCRELARLGKRVIVSGLEQDFKGDGFGPMPALLTEAEYVTKSLAICMKCGGPAHRNYRITEESEQVLVGSIDKYEARCRKCYEEK